MKAWARALVLLVLLAAVLAISPLRLLRIQGNSMHPTLLNGETYLLDQFYWRSGGLRRGDLVVVRHGQEKWVKRLAGLPGDELQIQRRLDADWIMHVGNLTQNPSVRKTEGRLEVVRLNPGEIFVIGDNLNWSADSTNQEAGAFRLDDVLGVVRTFTFRREFGYRQHP